MIWLVLLVIINAALAILLLLPSRRRPLSPWDGPEALQPSWWFSLPRAQSEVLVRAGLDLDPTAFLLVRLAFGLLAAGSVWLILGPVSAVCAAVASWLLVREWLRSRHEARLLRFAEQFRETLQSVASSLRAGRSMVQALEQADRDLLRIPGRERDLMVLELQRGIEELQMGAPLDAVLDGMANRVPLEEVRLFVDAVLISRLRGGNLVAVLQTLIRLNIDRFQVRQEIRVQTAQKRMEGSMVSLLPVLMLVVLTGIAPDYMAPLTDTALGQAVTGLGLTLVLIAYLAAQSFTRIEM